MAFFIVYNGGLNRHYSHEWRLLDSVSFLGHVMFDGEIVISPSNVEVVLEWKTPKSIFEIRSLHGLAGYYRGFIKDFSKLALPLTKLTSKNQPFVWDSKCEKNFQELKSRLTSAPILVLHDPIETFVVHCNTSKMGLGGMLMKKRGM
uniref:Pol polyprotein n=1 Tax=Cajanus cajan TaxID=3821 RepID=A0A151U363_CAJCA|nr:Pol polyprotein [Cajanus cajan]